MSVEACEKYTKDSVKWLNMLFSKDGIDVIVRTQCFMYECMKCDEFRKWCDKKKELIKFLDANQD